MPITSTPTAPTPSITQPPFRGALDVPCPIHSAPAGQPCYELPRGVCDERIPRPDPARTRTHQPSRASRDLAAKQRARRAEKDAARAQRAKRRGRWAA